MSRRRGAKLVRIWWPAVLLCLACEPESVPRLELPDRPGGAPGGTEVAREIRALDLEAREERIYDEIARGNVPNWLRRLQRVEMTGEVGGMQRRVTFWAAPDYLAVGSDDDFFLVPLSPRTARRIADLVGASLPTPGMVDAVWTSARVQLAPIRIDPDEFMTTVAYFERHDRLIRAQRRLYSVRPGALVAGHKLDLVVLAAPPPDRASVALYGWHRPDGSPIQPLFPVLADRAPHFSLGIRLVGRDVLVEGSRRELPEVLRDPELAALLNHARRPDV